MAPHPRAEGGGRRLCPPQAHAHQHTSCASLVSLCLDGDHGWQGGPLTQGWEKIESKSGNPWISSCKGDWKGEAEAPRDI